jgi:hypothetical protein
MNTDTNTTKPRYIILTAAARMPGNCLGRYRRVAVVELVPGFGETPKMISPRAKGVARIVAVWEKQNVGRTERCAYGRSLAAAAELCARLNG